MLAPNESRLYRLPPMSAGRIVIDAEDAYTTTGPHGTLVVRSGPTVELTLDLRHSEHLTRNGVNRILAESLWHDDLWRLRVRRNGVPDGVSQEPRQYSISAYYPSQFPMFANRIPASFFHDGF